MAGGEVDESLAALSFWYQHARAHPRAPRRSLKSKHIRLDVRTVVSPEGVSTVPRLIATKSNRWQPSFQAICKYRT